jgi:hypothetical protein
MKLAFLFSYFALASTTIRADHLEEDVYSLVTAADTWQTCALSTSDTCPPTVSIELAACEAALVVYGRVITVDDDETSPSYGAIEINVEYQSRLFSQPRKKIPKYGAGLDNQVNGTAFYDDSGFFTTWVFGFMPPTTRVSDPPCGTLLPRPQDELYFFLEALPENAGIEANVTEGNSAELTVNLTLSTTVLRSGTAPSDAWDYVDEGIFNDDFKLSGDCQAVYCCYNPDCADCEGVLEKYPGFSCPEWTAQGEKENKDDEVAAAGNSVGASAMTLALALGFVARLF